MLEDWNMMSCDDDDDDDDDDGSEVGYDDYDFPHHWASDNICKSYGYVTDHDSCGLIYRCG